MPAPPGPADAGTREGQRFRGSEDPRVVCNAGSPKLCEDGADYIRQNKARGVIVRVVRAALPGAFFSMDVSPWIVDQAGWFGRYNMADFAYVNTAGGGKRADSEYITHDNITLWRDIHRITGKRIIADCGYGVAGATTGLDHAWDNPVNIRARMTDGVVAIHQQNPRSDWDAILAALKTQL